MTRSRIRPFTSPATPNTEPVPVESANTMPAVQPAAALEPEIIPARPSQVASYHAPAGATLSIDQRSQLYRPVREELTLTFAKTMGNALAFPFRLVAKLFEGIFMGILGVAKAALLLILMPMLVIKGCMYADSVKDKSASEIAYDVGAGTLTITGDVASGAWDGLTGAEKPTDEAPAEANAQP
jgi:hypothetical protein